MSPAFGHRVAVLCMTILGWSVAVGLLVGWMARNDKGIPAILLVIVVSASITGVAAVLLTERLKR